MYIIIRSRTRHFVIKLTISDDGKDGLNHIQGAGDGASVNIYGKDELLSSVWDYGGYYNVYWSWLNKMIVYRLSCFVCCLVCAW